MSLQCSQAEAATLEQLGTARKVTIRATETTIIADAANREEIDMRVKQVPDANPKSETQS
jgi:chaperonin GroEL